ncbi:MAG TPA: hypothetical protein VGQ69_02030 [Gemmatimonadales bacterium]|jgi:hypothetical protein|nr:hypothetical protein [Gemmatimonadales bacterium]HEV8598119.1 hypothetical protein [Gemmatimonadales bacterium]
MPDDAEAPYHLMCSACYTPCPAADGHVVPHWRADSRRILTAYRCGSCWRQTLTELRAVVLREEPELPDSFCDFLARQGFTDTHVIRTAAPEQQRQYMLRILDAIENGQLTFHP